jgi:hypothetical protein
MLRHLARQVGGCLSLSKHTIPAAQDQLPSDYIDLVDE